MPGPFFYAEHARRRGRPPLSEAERKRRGSLVRRVARPEIDASHPLHVTLRARRDVSSLRAKGRFRRMRASIRAAADRLGMRVVQFAVLSNHVHLIVEAEDREALSRGMQGLAIRLARAVNRGERSGKVFRDRYYAVALDTPKRARNAVAYVLLNARRHAVPRAPNPARIIDPCSSGYWFDGWRCDVSGLRRAAEEQMDFQDSPTAAPRTWLLVVGWRKRGLIDPSEVPGGP